jgi:hypothetical protein
MCRSEANTDNEGFSTYYRAHAVATSANLSLRNHAASVFLPLAVASLFRAAVRIAKAVGIPEDVWARDEEMARALESQHSAGTDTVKRLKALLQGFVAPCEENVRSAIQRSKSDFRVATDVLGALAADVMQRRCSVLAKQSKAWENELSRLRSLNRFADADQLVLLMCTQVGQIMVMSPHAGLSVPEAEKQAAVYTTLRESIRSSSQDLIRAGTADSSTGHFGSRLPRSPLLPFGGCLERTWDSRSPSTAHAVVALRSIVATARACNVATMDEEASGLGFQAELGRRNTMASSHLLQAVLDDQLPARVAAQLTSKGVDSGVASAPLLAMAFFQQFLYCGHDARCATFAQIDVMAALLGAPNFAGNTGRVAKEVRTCICGILHDLIFGGGCEERITMRLARESAPRAAATLEEWFLDLLLSQNGATDFRQDIIQPGTEVDAWLSYCAYETSR